MRRWSGCRACLSIAGCRIPLRVPSGKRRGMKKHDRPASACASTRCASHCGAEKNHLWPVIAVRCHRRCARRASYWRARPSRLVFPSFPCRSVRRACARWECRARRIARDEARHPFPGQPGIAAHGGNGAVGHGGRAQRAAFHLRLHEVARRARGMRARRARRPSSSAHGAL